MRRYNRRVGQRELQVRDMVLHKTTLNTRDLVDGKLGPNRESL